MSSKAKTAGIVVAAVAVVVAVAACAFAGLPASLAGGDAGVTQGAREQSAPVLSAPSKLKVTARENGKIVVSWDAVAGADGYEVFRAAKGKKGLGGFSKVATKTKCRFVDKGGKARKTYCYKVRAFSKADNGAAMVAGPFGKARTTMCRAKPKRTAFLGDSVMSGFKGYGYLRKGERSFAAISRFIPTVLSRDVPDAISYKPDRVFIMVGTNDAQGTVGKKRAAALAKSYKRILVKLHKSNENMEIVVMGIGPVRKTGELSNKSVRAYNAALKKMVKKLSYAHFVDPGKTLCNDAGALKKKYDGGDGVHWAPVAYRDVRKQLDAFVKEW